MKILGVSLGTRNGSNDAMCKEALIAAQEMGDLCKIHPMRRHRHPKQTGF